ncbi:cationic amino acid transporter 3 [Plutella xylostella]|uniref:cationic amino acid transporter 3 n=1 Tax=Plutella xylostella TaxID=51655 RepID=UPI002032611D|nr:cationic amino acid transporter 3 [Plutella xylostella]XP_048478373.1 cationic amino acid transporter 3 [Plutella xylostella]
MSAPMLRALWRQVMRRRDFGGQEQLDETPLNRCLNTWDLTALGLGSTLGVGVYVLVGSVAADVAGPAVVVSFLIAAVASLFAGLCYAEFGSRIPRAGSSYIYTYVAVGELAAFVIGWNVVLECMLGAASVARGLSMHVDNLSGKAMSAWGRAALPMAVPYLADYFDVLAFIIVVLLGGIVCVGVKQSSIVNNVFTIINMAVIAFILVAGAFKVDPANWSIPAEKVPAGFGTGGFFPYGVWGAVKGAALCFYGFVGFDSISFTGEEVRQPRRSIPVSILAVLAVVALAYCAVAAVVTMMLPYYLLERMSAVAFVFEAVGWDWARWVVAVGAVFGMLASLFGSLIPMPRLLYAMASDGLMCRCLAHVSTRGQSPVAATLLSVALIAFLSSTMELTQLIMMLCVGTLMSYTFVAACVIALRYASPIKPASQAGLLRQLFGCGERHNASSLSSNIVNVTTFLFVVVSIAAALVGLHLDAPLVPLVTLNVVAVALVLVISLQPTAKEELAFKTPLVPLIPCLSIYIDIHLMMHVSPQTWIRVLIWILIGLPIYFTSVWCYSLRQSNPDNDVNSASNPHAEKNGKHKLQIVIEPPTPSGTMERKQMEEKAQTPSPPPPTQDKITNIDKINTVQFLTEEIIVQQAVIDHYEEKEAKIIDLLDQVLQAEEDAYGEVKSITSEDNIVALPEPNVPSDTVILYNKSYSELSDAGSEASLSITGLSKYDVIAQVHREDMPIVSEESNSMENIVLEKTLNEEDQNLDPNEENQPTNEIHNQPEGINETNVLSNEHEQVTRFNESESNSGTDESGYSDTTDFNNLNDSVEDTTDEPKIPSPPPMDENYFATPIFKKSYTIASRPNKSKLDDVVENTPRESVTSNASNDDNIVFGSARQQSFMSKLNNIFQTKILNPEEVIEKKPEALKRSLSVGNLAKNNDLKLANNDDTSPPPPPPMLLFADLKKELLSRDNSSLKSVSVREKEPENIEEEDEIEGRDTSLSKEDLKSKLENLFATGGPKPFRQTSHTNLSTPEETNETETSSVDSTPKIPKIEKNDTLKRQKAIFGEVLNSFRLSLHKDDNV